MTNTAARVKKPPLQFMLASIADPVILLRLAAWTFARR
jgi:hypothetical protein